MLSGFQGDLQSPMWMYSELMYRGAQTDWKICGAIALPPAQP